MGLIFKEKKIKNNASLAYFYIKNKTTMFQIDQDEIQLTHPLYDRGISIGFYNLAFEFFLIIKQL